jgi:hypothetical protein
MKLFKFHHRNILRANVNERRAPMAVKGGEDSEGFVACEEGGISDEVG